MTAGTKSQSVDNAPVLAARNLVKHYRVGKAGIFQRQKEYVRAVDGVSLEIAAGRTLGLVGESGCGKSTLGRLIVHLEKATSGTIDYLGVDLTRASEAKLRHIRRDIQIIFQDPYASLNPRMTVQQILSEPFQIHGLLDDAGRRQRVRELLEAVGLSAAHAGRYPHEFSGGQRQRIGIARAIALKPKLIVCDEPVSALDVSIQAQVLNLLKQLQRELGLSYLFIAHGMAAVKHISDEIGVMYLGKLVEKAPKKRLFAMPAHPYTRALISAIPKPDPGAERNRIVLQGDIPSPINPPSGCRFHTRCSHALQFGALCARVEPQPVELAPGHTVGCHLYSNAGGPSHAL